MRRPGCSRMAGIATVKPMPSPVGHALAGMTLAWLADAAVPAASDSSRRFGRFAQALGVGTLAWAALAISPDADLLLASHRTLTHSVGGAVVAGILAGMLARWRHWPVARTAVLATLVIGSHAALDWLGRDHAPPSGIMALWPFTRAYFTSAIDLFPEVSRRYWKPDEFLLGNARTVAVELLILVPPALAALLLRARRARAR
jgi:hypothetical protein